MWSSIKQIIKPERFSEALVLGQESGAAFFSGGTYLMATQTKTIHTLLDLNHLLSDQIEKRDKNLIVGAGSSLQKLLDSDSEMLSAAIIASCPSKNIRNQRTLGGEIAQGRPDSDLLVYLHAAEANLQLNDAETWVPLSEWDGAGIISTVLIPATDTKMERVSVLDSAPAFVIVGLHQTMEFITLAIGGKASKILYVKTPIAPEEAKIRAFMETVESLFTQDHFGSPAYKRQLVSNLLCEMMVEK